VLFGHITRLRFIIILYELTGIYCDNITPRDDSAPIASVTYCYVMYCIVLQNVPKKMLENLSRSKTSITSSIPLRSLSQHGEEVCSIFTFVLSGSVPVDDRGSNMSYGYPRIHRILKYSKDGNAEQQ